MRYAKEVDEKDPSTLFGYEIDKVELMIYLGNPPLRARLSHLLGRLGPAPGRTVACRIRILGKHNSFNFTNATATSCEQRQTSDNVTEPRGKKDSPSN